MATPVMIRTSERTTFKSCRQKWDWAYNAHLRAKRIRPALEFGSLIHNALEIYYPPGIKRGPNPVKTVEQLWMEYLRKGGEPFNVIKDVPAVDLAVEMMKNYLAEYGKDDEFKVISSEQTFQIDVYDPVTGKFLFTYVGTFDGVWFNRRTKKYGFAEHKTGAGLDPFGAPTALDEQSGSYWAYGPDWLRAQGILKPTEDVDFLLFNRLRKAFADTRPVNEDGHSLNSPTVPVLKAALAEEGYEIPKGAKKDDLIELYDANVGPAYLLGEVSDRQPGPLFKRELIYRAPEDRATLMRRVISEAREMRLIRAGKLDVYKNPDRHCGYCEFRDMCEVHETGSDWEAIRDEMFTTWDPYDAHSIVTEREATYHE